VVLTRPDGLDVPWFPLDQLSLATNIGEAEILAAVSQGLLRVSIPVRNHYVFHREWVEAWLVTREQRLIESPIEITPEPGVLRVPSTRKQLQRQLDATKNPKLVNSQPIPVSPYAPSGPCKVGHVYFIATADERFVKIGTSLCVKQRMLTLQAAHPEKLKLIAFIRGGTSKEALWQRRWRALRRIGEWFELTDELRAAIMSEARSTPEAKA